ncbi:MAG TPA: ABC transporter permease [Gammaproteobacteria bacterium]|nr:ABC transporter permease [Gammaproteobacteria bacterium]
MSGEDTACEGTLNFPAENAWVGAITPDYLRVMDIPLLEGRFFTPLDTTASPAVIVIDDVMAQHLFPNQDAVGKEFRM